MREYIEERIRQEDIASEASLGYETEYQEYLIEHPLITFHEFLKATKKPEPVCEEVGAA